MESKFDFARVEALLSGKSTQGTFLIDGPEK